MCHQKVISLIVDTLARERDMYVSTISTIPIMMPKSTAITSLIIFLGLVSSSALSSAFAIQDIGTAESSLFPKRYRRHLKASAATVSRGGGIIARAAKEDDAGAIDEGTDFGGTVAGMFGNLRIPASLVAGAALGSSFALPLAPTDGLQLGFIKRVYALLMMSSLAGMLMSVVVSTICMNDIALAPNPRKTQSTGSYIEEYYPLEWMVAKTSFMMGNMSFVVGSMLRAWIFLSCPIVAKGVVGIMSSFTLMSAALLREFTKRQTGKSSVEQAKNAVRITFAKAKKNPLCGVAALLFLVTQIYLVIKIPHMYNYLMLQES